MLRFPFSLSQNIEYSNMQLRDHHDRLWVEHAKQRGLKVSMSIPHNKYLLGLVGKAKAGSVV